MLAKKMGKIGVRIRDFVEYPEVNRVSRGERVYFVWNACMQRVLCVAIYAESGVCVV